MTDIDRLVMIDLFAIREQAVQALQKSHPDVLSSASALLSGKKNRIGLEVTTAGKSLGQYTLHLDGLKVIHTEIGKLDPLVNHPLIGHIRPYAVIERAVLERVLTDKRLTANPLAEIGKYLPYITIKFLP